MSLDHKADINADYQQSFYNRGKRISHFDLDLDSHIFSNRSWENVKEKLSGYCILKIIGE